MKKLEQIFAILGALVLVLIATNISTVSAAVSSNYWKLQGGVLKPASNAWSVDSGDIAFTDTSADTGLGVWLTGNEYIATSTPGNVLSLLDFSFKNRATSTGDGQFYGLKITTEADAIDTAAGILIENNGRADAMYLGVKGKSGSTTDNAPSGIGIDLNRGETPGTENSSTYEGTGLHVWDFSTTSNGDNGPFLIKLNKENNPSNDHRMLYIRGNQRAIEIYNPLGTGYDSTKSVFRLFDDTSGEKLNITAAGDIGRGRLPTDNIDIYSSSTTVGLTIDKGGVAGRIYNDGNLHVSGGGTNVWLDGGGVYLNGNGGNATVNTTTQTGKLTVLGEASSTLPNISLITAGSAQGETSGISFKTTFEGTGDNGIRRSADILSGFDGGAWGEEFLSFNVGNNGSSNDSSYLSSEKMRIQGDGNVGIGTTAPATKLDVYNATATSSAYIYSGGAGLGGRLILEDYDGGGCTAVVALDGVLSAAVVACP